MTARRPLKDTGLCIGGPWDRQKRAVREAVGELAVPIGVFGAQFDVGMSVRTERYSYELLADGDAIYGVWVHESIKSGNIIAALLASYAAPSLQTTERCTRPDGCVCGGDTPAVRAACSWME